LTLLQISLFVICNEVTDSPHAAVDFC